VNVRVNEYGLFIGPCYIRFEFKSLLGWSNHMTKISWNLISSNDSRKRERLSKLIWFFWVCNLEINYRRYLKCIPNKHIIAFSMRIIIFKIFLHFLSFLYTFKNFCAMLFFSINVDKKSPLAKKSKKSSYVVYRIFG